MDTHAPATSTEKSGPCIARQPILTVDEEVFGYELLFRENSEKDSFAADGESATRTTIDTLNVLGLDVLCDGKLAFINCTRQMLENDYFLLLPPSEIVVEIQEKVPSDETLISACQRLKQAGYAIALDNFTPGDAREPFVPYADFIKVDILHVPPAESSALAARYANKTRRMVAQKVESRQTFVTAKNNGFTLFQGYFFRHPERMRARQIPAHQSTYLLLLRAISKSQPDSREIEELVKREPSLCYRLLRYLNSPLLAISSPVLSVRHALDLLGEREQIRWIRMATTLVLGHDKPSDLVLSSLVRARFCELMAPKINHGESDLFLLGILSLIDAILEVPIGVVVEKLTLDPEIEAQLLAPKSGATTPLSPIYDLMVAREAGDWERVNALGKQFNLSLYFINKTYTEAMRWAATQLPDETRPNPSRIRLAPPVRNLSGC
jgi:c-di-GMP-related signal transduction protein